MESGFFISTVSSFGKSMERSNFIRKNKKCINKPGIPQKPKTGKAAPLKPKKSISKERTVKMAAMYFMMVYHFQLFGCF